MGSPNLILQGSVCGDSLFLGLRGGADIGPKLGPAPSGPWHP